MNKTDKKFLIGFLKSQIEIQKNMFELMTNCYSESKKEIFEIKSNQINKRIIRLNKILKMMESSL